ncbi:uncharacterized protein LODBEIA_P55700 [Lodderomyces beijingensis]|uniref:COMPASS component SDC1 n=1 Tax=Lodderomyces beijingensis TaxID=1775926 RepID=A0ABP0ZVK6_9ASCO
MDLRAIVQERDATPLPQTEPVTSNSDQSEVKEETDEMGEKEVQEESEAETTPVVKENSNPHPNPIKQEAVNGDGSPQRTPQPQVQQLTQETLEIKEDAVEDPNLPPLHEIVGGSSVRRYLNKHLTKHLLDGLKEVGRHKPEDPLKYLGEFLIARSIVQHAQADEGET